MIAVNEVGTRQNSVGLAFVSAPPAGFAVLAVSEAFLGSLRAVDCEIRAVHAAQVAAAAFFRMHDMGRMIALGIEGGRERQHMRGTKLHAKATALQRSTTIETRPFATRAPS